MKSVSRFILTVGLVGAFAGCQTNTQQTPSVLSPEAAAVSSIPWNKPASWEGAGALGGMMPQGGH